MARSALRTVRQFSAGGVAFRLAEAGIMVALISVGPSGRWQLPKGTVEPSERVEQTAVREVREEAGLETDLLMPLETIEYWYVASHQGGERLRYHKRVQFFLLACTGGDVRDHDDEVNEARWFPLNEAVERLAFANERRVMERARDLLQQARTEIGPSPQA